MAKKAGICRNIDCDNYKQVIEVEAGEEFECPLCHQPLEDAGSGGSKGGKKKGGQGGGPNFKLIGIIIAALLLLGGIGFGVYTLINKLSGDSKPTVIKLAKSKLQMKVGETIVLTPMVEPEGAKATFNFKPSKSSKSLVKITAGGEVTALKEGEAVIRIKCEENPDISKICKITIVEDSLKGDSDTLIQKITIKESSITMTVGEQRGITVSFVPEDFNEQILISSSDENVAELSTNDGKIVAKKVGTAVITIKGEKSGVAASINVTVKKPQSPPETPPGTLKLSYGIYNGATEVIGGKRVPNGSGKLTFTRSYRLNSQYTAQPGEYVQGIFENGVPTFVTYYQKDGTVTKIKTR